MGAKVTLITIFTFIVMAAIAWQSDTSWGQVVTDGLVSYWSFDKADIEGETAKDIWGNNDGVIVGGAKTVEGVVREALDFDGVDDCVDCGNDGSLNITEEMTIEFWINPRENTENRHIISRGEWAAGGYWVQHCDPGNVGGLYFYLDGVYQAFIVPAGSSELNIWHHFLLTYDGTTVKSYKNGELLNEAPANGSITSKDTNFMISRYAALDLHHFDGIIDEVRVYNRALNADEAGQNFLAEGLAVAPDGRLALTWGEIKVPK
jgi:hypothetical protein